MRALVTGGSRGIGRAICDYFRAKGLEVESPSRESLDLSKKIFLTDNKFDIVVNCAGINPINCIYLSGDEEVMQVNFRAPLDIIQSCLPHMSSQKYGRIVNIGSIWIEFAKPGRLDYSCSKQALHGLTKMVAAEYGHNNVLCNTVSPGFVATEMTYKNNTKEQIEKLTKSIPVGRMAAPEEIAPLVYHLTVENSFINGQNIIIDGGYSCCSIQ